MDLYTAGSQLPEEVKKQILSYKPVRHGNQHGDALRVKTSVVELHRHQNAEGKKTCGWKNRKKYKQTDTSNLRPVNGKSHHHVAVVNTAIVKEDAVRQKQTYDQLMSDNGVVGINKVLADNAKSRDTTENGSEDLETTKIQIATLQAHKESSGNIERNQKKTDKDDNADQILFNGNEGQFVLVAERPVVSRQTSETKPENSGLNTSLTDHIKGVEHCIDTTEEAGIKTKFVIEKTSGKYHCSNCERVFKSRAGVYSHVRSVHRRSYVYRCSHCDKTFMFKPHYIGHMNKHNQVKPFICEKCDKSFGYKPALNLHQKSCTGKKTNQNFPTKSGTKHKVLCDICGTALSSKSALKQHYTYVHSNRSSQVCHDCGKCFKTDATLKRHSRISHGDGKARQYSCEKCGLKFKQVEVLRQHLKRHNKDFKVYCETCGKG